MAISRISAGCCACQAPSSEGTDAAEAKSASEQAAMLNAMTELFKMITQLLKLASGQGGGDQGGSQGGNAVNPSAGPGGATGGGGNGAFAPPSTSSPAGGGGSIPSSDGQGGGNGGNSSANSAGGSGGNAPQGTADGGSAGPQTNTPSGGGSAGGANGFGAAPSDGSSSGGGSAGSSGASGTTAGSQIDSNSGQLSLSKSNENLSQYYQGGDMTQKDQWGSSQNVDKPKVFDAVYQGVKDGWENGAIPDTVKNFFSDSKTDQYYDGLQLSSDPTTKAQQKAAIWQLGVAQHETGGNYDPGKLPSYYKAGGDGSGAGQTQQAGMSADPDGMTYGMFSTQSNTPIDVSDPRQAVVADLQKFGFNLDKANGNLGSVLNLIAQTDGTSVIPSIQKYGNDYLAAFS
jgi:hypothetical protein